MRIDLEILDSKKSQEFLSYFIALLKEKNQSSTIGMAHASYNADGQYETTIQDNFRTLKGDDIVVVWTVVQNLDGTIPYIDVTSLTGTDLRDNYESLMGFITKVQVTTLASKKQKYFHRSYYCYTNASNLDGEFWIGQNIRVAPLYPEDQSFQPIAEKVIVIDQTIMAIDLFHSRQLGEELAIQISAQLSFLLDIGLYLPKTEQRWVIQTNPTTNKTENLRLLTGIVDHNIPQTLSKPGQVCNLSHPTGSIFDFEKPFYDKLSFPSESKSIFDSIESCEPKLSNALNRACRLYQTGLTIGKDYPTIKISYLYSAIDAICKTTASHKGFSNFVQFYFPEAKKELLDFIHKNIRSAHWHSGIFSFGENESKTKEFILDRNQLLRHNLDHACHAVIRNALLKWLFTEIVKE